MNDLFSFKVTVFTLGGETYSYVEMFEGMPEAKKSVAEKLLSDRVLFVADESKNTDSTALINTIVPVTSIDRVEIVIVGDEVWA